MTWPKRKPGDPRILAQKTNKYHAEKTVKDGIAFDSKFEARRYGELLLLEKAGEIFGIKVHPVFPLLDHFRDPWSGKCERGISYIGDFLYQAKDLHFVCEDTKGVETSDFRIKWKLAKSSNRNIEFKIVKRGV